MKLTRKEELELRAKRIHAQRQTLQKEIEAAANEAARWYREEAVPAMKAGAGVYQTAPMTKGKPGQRAVPAQRLDTTSPLSMKEAENLDVSKPTGRFERARAYIEHFGGIARSKRAQEGKLAAELDRIREELGRIARAAGGPVPDPTGPSWGALPAAGHGRPAYDLWLPTGAAERVDALRALAQDARSGLALLQGVA